MTNMPQSQDLQSLWQSLPDTPIRMTTEDLRGHARKLDSRIRRRFIIEYGASVVVIPVFAWYATWREPATPLWPIANVTIIAGTLFMLWNLHRVSRRHALPPSAPFSTLVEHHRANLVQQRDALRSVWLWYLMPFVPGFVLWITALWVSRPEGPAGDRMAIALIFTAFWAVAVFAVLLVINLVGARRLQRQIDDLDAYKDQ